MRRIVSYESRLTALPGWAASRRKSKSAIMESFP